MSVNHREDARKERPTLEVVARRAYVAKSTASRALRGDPRIAADTRKRVAEVALELGYDPLVEAPRSGIAGIVSASGMDDSFADPFQMDIVSGIAEGLSALGMGVLFVPPAGTAGHDDVVSRIPLDVCFLLHGFSTYSSTRASLQRRGVPVLVLEAEPDDPAPSVRTNERQAFRDLMDIVIGVGHRRAAVVSLPLSHHRVNRGFVTLTDLGGVDVVPARERLEVMEESGLERAEVFETTRSLEDEGELAAAAFLALPELPTLIVCHSDLLAVGVVTALTHAGVRIPEDVSVTGFDGLDIPLLAPLVLASVTQDGYEKGRLLADQARRLLTGQPPAPGELYLTARAGNSVGPPRPKPAAVVTQ